MKSRVALVYLFIGLIKWSSIRAVYFYCFFIIESLKKNLRRKFLTLRFFFLSESLLCMGKKDVSNCILFIHCKLVSCNFKLT